MTPRALLALLILAAPLPAADPADKIDPAVLEQVQTQGEATYWVRFDSSADLEPAYGMGWVERGRYVHQELVRAAEAAQAQALAQLQEHGVAHQAFWAAPVIVVRSGREDLLALAAREEVDRVVADLAMSVEPLPGEPEPTQGTVEWGVARVRAPEAWAEFGALGEGIVVGSIDTGVAYTHPALAAQYRGRAPDGTVSHAYNWHDPSRSCPLGTPCDNNRHGTHTIGTVLGGDGPGPFLQDIGVAPGAKWIAAKGCENQGCSFSSLLSAGQWMIAPTDIGGANANPDLRPHVVTNSWGGGPGQTFFRGVVDAWLAAGMFPAFAAGNAGSACRSVGSPGDYPASFAVGATTSSDLIASFSSRGPSFFGPLKPEISAPGQNVRSAIPGSTYAALSGTSMATPHVAGAVAILWGRVPALIGKVPETAALLRATARDRPDLACGGDADGDPNNAFGDGILDVLSALRAAVQPLPFRRGQDCRADGHFDLTDPIALLGFLFTGGARPDCLEACDAQDDGLLDVSDAVYMLGFLFLGTAPPAAPWPACGGGSLDCQRSSC